MIVRPAESAFREARAGVSRSRSGRSRREPGRVGGRARRLINGLLVCLLAATGTVVAELAEAPSPAAAAPVAAPEMVRVQSFANRTSDIFDEVRADFILKVPHGYVNPTTGDLQAVGGNQLRVGYEYGYGANISATYINTMKNAAGGATWAANHGQSFTIRKVIVSGANDYLVMSLQGDMDHENLAARHNTLGGYPETKNWYFSFASGAPTASTAWIPSALTSYPVEYLVQYGNPNAALVTGPEITMQADGIYQFWSGAQASWGQALDFGLNGQPPGVMPPNSVAIDVVNKGFSSANSGPAGSVSDSFWYAWVHEDGSLVTAINTAPIHITGTTPLNYHHSPNEWVAKNAPKASGPTLAYTPEQAAQGLTQAVGTNGAIDFRSAGGTGHYRLLAWPESHNPTTVTQDFGAPLYSFTPGDLFDANGYLTPNADSLKWTVASATYRYSMSVPDAPVITAPVHASTVKDNTSVTVAGTGVPGSTITLATKAGGQTADPYGADLTTLVDGDHIGAVAGDIVVDDQGNWTYTYTPATPLPDGEHTFVASQTDQTAGSNHLTSSLSNPDDANAPTKWGVTITVDPNAISEVEMVCLTSPTTDTSPTFTGTGATPGADRIEVTVMDHSTGGNFGGAQNSRTPTVAADGTWTWTSHRMPSGTYTYTLTQWVGIGNGNNDVKRASCDLTIDATLGLEMTVRDGGVENGLPQFPATPKNADNWEAVYRVYESAPSGGSWGSPVRVVDQPRVPKGHLVDLAVRARTSPAPDAGSELHGVQSISCTDDAGVALPQTWMKNWQLQIGLGNENSSPPPQFYDYEGTVKCEAVVAAAHASLWVQRVGGTTVPAPAGWSLEAKQVPAYNPWYHTPQNFTLSGDGDTGLVVQPNVYNLTPKVPAGLTTVTVQQLNWQPSTGCEAYANNANQAPEDCWMDIQVPMSGGNVEMAPVQAGHHTAYRILAAAPEDMPTLPLTGGLGTWLFTSAGIGALAIAITAYGRRRFLVTRPAPLTK